MAPLVSSPAAEPLRSVHFVMPLPILLTVDEATAAFHDFDEYERLVEVARSIDARTLLVVLLGGDAGMRCGEIIALEWGDVDLAKRQLCVRQSDWNGQLGTPKSGRLRYVPAHATADRGAR
jgi:integrase